FARGSGRDLQNRFVPQLLDGKAPNGAGLDSPGRALRSPGVRCVAATPADALPRSSFRLVFFYSAFRISHSHIGAQISFPPLPSCIGICTSLGMRASGRKIELLPPRWEKAGMGVGTSIDARPPPRPSPTTTKGGRILNFPQIRRCVDSNAPRGR